jgi:hypothetical protein
MLWQCQTQKAFLSVYSLLYPRLPFDKLPTLTIKVKHTGDDKRGLGYHLKI